MHLYVCWSALAKDSTISIVEYAIRNGEAGGVWEERDCTTSRREKKNRESAGRLQKDNANCERRGFIITSRERSATNGRGEWYRSKNRNEDRGGGTKKGLEKEENAR